jgi:hypothetical protein
MVFSRTFMGRRDWEKWGILGRSGGTFDREQMRSVGVSEGKKTYRRYHENLTPELESWGNNNWTIRTLKSATEWLDAWMRAGAGVLGDKDFDTGSRQSITVTWEFR